MQPLLAAPRQGLTPAIVGGLLADDENIQVLYGADLLDTSQNFVSDLTPFMSAGSTISRDNYATIHGTCNLNIDSDAPISLNSQLIRPWQTLVNPDTSYSAKFYLGVYTCTSPDHDTSTQPSVLSAQGYDLLYYLNQPIGDSVQFPAGSNPINDAIALIGTAMGTRIVVVNSVPFSGTLSADAVYPFDEQDSSTTYLGIINDLLAACGYTGLWADWNGTLQMVPYVSPTKREPEYYFDLTNNLRTIVAAQRSTNQDLFSVPNWWRFVMQGIAGSPVEGTNQVTIINNQSSDPTSIASRGLTIPKVAFVQATDYPTLVAIANQTVAADRRPTETLTMNTSPFPIAWHFDQGYINDPNLMAVSPRYSQYRRVQAQSWTMPLDADGGDMSWVWETVN